jgi:acyl-coenzyme A thioesterase PaaI-like protein
LATDYFNTEPAEGAFALEAGWVKLPTTGFSAAIGAIHVRGEAGQRIAAIDCGAAISNERIGNVHGGALMTFADIALGIRVADTIGHVQMATVQLQYGFAGGVRVGSRLICRADLVRRTSTLVFVRGLFEAGGKTVGTAEGIYRAFDP